MPRGKPNYVDPIRKSGPTRNVTTVKQRPKAAVVYFVQAENGQIKIGSTKYIEWRMNALRGQSPLGLELLATTPGNRKVEFGYHARFADDRLHGEWFRPSPSILAEIDRLGDRHA